MKPPTFPRTHTLKARALRMLLKAYALTHLGIMLDGKTDESAVEVARVNAYKGIFK